jgi:hypothetical protein
MEYLFTWQVLFILGYFSLPTLSARITGHDIECPIPPEISSNCTTIERWHDFVEAIETATSDSPLVFCPFNITKEEDESAAIVPESNIHIACQKANACMVQGRGSHIIILGDASATIQQMNFSGATETSIRIFGTAAKQHLFCDCQFQRCVHFSNLPVGQKKHTPEKVYR